ncbi:MAG TPA: MFS transporter [Candidatus Dormibacteraeota bacterium]
MFTVFGVAYSFGAFFDPMAREFHVNRASTSAVFSITSFLWFALGSVTGLLADRLGPRRVLLVGMVVMAAGLGLTSLAPNIWIGYLAYGLGVGIGTACGYVPLVAAVGGWFDPRRRSLAIGIAVTGIGVGTLLVPPLAAAGITAWGWRRTYLVLAVGTVVLLSLAAAFARRPPHVAGADLRLGAAVRSRRFMVMYGGGILASFALFMAFVHLVPFAVQRGIAPVTAAALIGAIGIGSTASRTTLGWAAARLGVVRTYQASTALLGLSFAVWLAFPSYAGLVVFALLLGFGYGGWVALSPSVVAELFGARGLGGSVGFLYTSAAIGSLFGPPVAGLIVDRSGSYTVAIGAALVLGVLSAALLLPLPARRVESI